MNMQLEARYYVNNAPILLTFHLNTDEGYYRELRQALRIRRVLGSSFVRAGNDHDGGYIMLNEFYRNGVAYSFGINDDVSWDWAMAWAGYEVFLYDPTIDALPQKNERFHFFREGIAGHPEPEKSLDTLANFLARNHHENRGNMILKMDVEGAEWDFLTTVDTGILKQFDQLVFEFHNLCAAKSKEEMADTIYLLKKLNETHALIHLHGNNTAWSIKTADGYIPNTIEATYVKPDSRRLSEADDILLPISLDAPNSPGHGEVPLGYWNRVWPGWG